MSRVAKQPVELPQQHESPSARATRQQGGDSRALRVGIGGEKAAVHPLGQQPLVQPEGPAGGAPAEGSGRQMQHPHGASTRYPNP